MIRIEPPLTPNDDTARLWVEQELAKNKYNSGESLWARFRTWLDDLLNGVNGDGSGTTAFSIAVIAVLVIALVVFVIIPAIKARRMRARQLSQAEHTSALVFDDTRSAPALLEAARQAELRGDHATALIEHYRAAIRALADAGAIAVSPQLTAVEAGHLAGGITEREAMFTRSAYWFDRLYYGKAQSAPEVEMLTRALDSFTRTQISEITKTLAEHGQAQAQRTPQAHGDGSPALITSSTGGDREQ